MRFAAALVCLSALAACVDAALKPDECEGNVCIMIIAA